MEDVIEKPVKLSFSALQNMWKNSVRIFRMLWAERKGQLVLYTVLLGIVSTLPFLQSGVMGIFINDLSTGKIQGFDTNFTLLVIVFIAVTLASPFLWMWERYVEKMFWFFLNKKMEILTLEKKKDLDIATLEDPKKNDVINRISENSWRVQNFADREFYILQSLFGVILAAVIVWTANWWIFLLIFLSTIPELTVGFKFGKSLWGIHDARAEVRRRYWDTRHHFTSMSALTELKLFQNTKHFIVILSELFENFQKEERKNEKRRVVWNIFALVVSQGAIAVALVFLIREVVHGTLLIGTLTFLIASISQFRQTLSLFFSQIGWQYEDNLFIKDFFEFIGWEPIIKNDPECIKKDTAKTPKIEFRNVSFSYPGTTKKSLSKVSFILNPGEKFALVGKNGAGKTTIIKLLCRFYDPTEGKILIDDVDLRDIDIHTWHEMLGVLFQEYAQYNLPVNEAIAMGRTSVPMSIEKVVESAESSEADEFIRDWKGGYNQMLGKEFTDGVEPSIGQWQKLALARTFYRDPRLYVFDEPTASIDAEAEAKIFEKLESLPKDRSVIIISHRFSTVRRAHTIIVLKDGRIEEQGTHQELLKKNKLYAKLFTLQAKGYK